MSYDSYELWLMSGTQYPNPLLYFTYTHTNTLVLEIGKFEFIF